MEDLSREEIINMLKKFEDQMCPEKPSLEELMDTKLSSKDRIKAAMFIGCIKEAFTSNEELQLLKYMAAYSRESIKKYMLDKLLDKIKEIKKESSHSAKKAQNN